MRQHLCNIVRWWLFFQPDATRESPFRYPPSSFPVIPLLCPHSSFLLDFRSSSPASLPPSLWFERDASYQRWLTVVLCGERKGRRSRRDWGGVERGNPFCSLQPWLFSLLTHSLLFSLFKRLAPVVTGSHKCEHLNPIQSSSPVSFRGHCVYSFLFRWFHKPWTFRSISQVPFRLHRSSEQTAPKRDVSCRDINGSAKYARWPDHHGNSWHNLVWRFWIVISDKRPSSFFCTTISALHSNYRPRQIRFLRSFFFCIC